MPSAYTVCYFVPAGSPRMMMIGKKNSRCPNNGGQHAFPGGRVNQGESQLNGAWRELNEETGISIPMPKLGSTLFSNQKCTSQIRNFQYFSVLYVNFKALAGLKVVSVVSKINLPLIPSHEREFVEFKVVTDTEALQIFAAEHNPSNNRKSTDWFTTAVQNIP